MTKPAWPEGVGVVRFARRTTQPAPTVAFYRDLVGCRRCPRSTGMTAPTPSAEQSSACRDTSDVENVDSHAPVPVDSHELLVLYFSGPLERDKAVQRLDAAGQLRCVQ